MKEGDRIIYNHKFGYDIGRFMKNDMFNQNECKILLLSGSEIGERFVLKNRVEMYSSERI